MKGPNRNGQGNCIAIAVLCMVLLLLPLSLPSSSGESVKPSLSPQERLRLGERMYREGILPSGEPMQAFIKGDIPVAGTAFTCVSCHLRSGLGSIEGGVFTPPTNGSKLFRPLQTLYKGVEQNPKYFPIPPRRPAYTDESLALVLRGGVDPTGRTLNDVMPRYLLEDEDMALLILYLKSLSLQFSPGVSDTTLRFATILTEDVSPEDRNAMLVPLDYYVKSKNAQAKADRTQAGGRSRAVAESMLPSKELAYRSLSLSRWVLKGPPETWRGQLEEYYRKEPVFALIGGIAKGEWKPIHQFSEDNHLPCLFPNTDFPVISETDWYTLYLSKGYYQEGEGAARYINGMDELLRGKPIVQIVRDSPQGRALSAGFQETWRDLGRQAPVTFTLKTGETLTKEFLQQVLAQEKPAAIVLWVGSEALPALEILAAGENRPEMALVSSIYLGKSIWTLKEEVRDFTYITYPFRLPQDEERYKGYIEPLMRNTKVQGDAEMISKRTFSVIQVLTQALMDMRGNYYRDNFFDVIGMMQDQKFPLYERLSFGPGQRYASKGCYIVQLTKGPEPKLIKKSDWVVH